MSNEPQSDLLESSPQPEVEKMEIKKDVEKLNVYGLPKEMRDEVFSRCSTGTLTTLCLMDEGFCMEARRVLNRRLPKTEEQVTVYEVSFPGDPMRVKLSSENEMVEFHSETDDAVDVFIELASYKSVNQLTLKLESLTTSFSLSLLPAVTSLSISVDECTIEKALMETIKMFSPTETFSFTSKLPFDFSEKLLNLEELCSLKFISLTGVQLPPNGRDLIYHHSAATICLDLTKNAEELALDIAECLFSNEQPRRRSIIVKNVNIETVDKFVDVASRSHDYTILQTSEHYFSANYRYQRVLREISIIIDSGNVYFQVYA